MARRAPRADILKVLYARSGNQCAFPGCVHPIFNDKGLYIAQLCHIEAALPGGPRYNENQSEEERNGIDNLLFLCHRHHKETDDIDEFSVEKLKHIKANHEKQFTEAGREASNNMIRQVQYEIEYFWNKQKIKEFELSDLKIERDFELDIKGLFNELEENIMKVRNYCDLTAQTDSDTEMQKDLTRLFDLAGIDIKELAKVPYYKNPFINRNWEFHNIGRPNLFTHVWLSFLQLKLRVFEALINSNPADEELKAELEECRKRFEDLYDNAYYVD